MTVPRSPTVDQLAELERQFSRRGLLMRYARGRVRHFPSRQVLTAAGALSLTLTDGPLTGGLAILMALVGEAVDCAFLHAVPRLVAKGVPIRHLQVISTATAVFQACTIAACVSLAWHGPVSSASPLFAVAFLAGAAVNAGLVLPHHPAAGIARLLVYGATAVGLHLPALLVSYTWTREDLLNTAGAVMLAYMVATFLFYVNAGFRRHRRITLELTERSRDLFRHQKESQMLSLVARNANDSVIVSDSSRRIIWVNDAFTRITGYSAEEALGRRPGDLLNGPDTDERVVARIADAVSSGQPFRGEIQNITKDGRKIWMETNLVPVIGEDGDIEIAVAVERDVTAARQHAREMAEARQAAEEGARAKAEFLATMSHEIRTPMNGVIGMADLLAETPLDPEQLEFVRTIRNSATALLTIINDVLDLSRLDARQMVLHPVDFDLEGCFSETLRLLRPQADAKNLQLVFDVTNQVPDRVHGDDGRLRQVLINLIGNAIKFTETGRVTVKLGSDPQPGGGFMLTIDVIDTGIGIAPDKIEHVFERFSQADAATTRLYGGTGLGLTITRDLVLLMGGRTLVESTEGEGSCFTVQLPVGDPLNESAADFTDDAAAGGTLFEGLRILVAEDNKVNRLLIRKYLDNLPLELRFAHDGSQAVNMVRDQMPDLIFMDVSMPVMNGLEATRQIRAAGGLQPPIIALTANAFSSDRRACQRAGMNDFLSKPVRRADLLARMAMYARQYTSHTSQQ